MNITTSYRSLRSRLVPVEPLDLVSWRNWLIRVMIIFIAIGFPLAIAAILPVLIRAKQYELIALDAAIWLYLVTQALIKRRSYRANAYLFLTAIYTMMIAFFITPGPFHACPTWFVMCAVLASLLFGLRAAVVSAAVNAAILMVLYASLGPENQNWAAEYTAPFSKWMMIVVNVSIITVASSVPVGFLLNRLNQSLRDERKAHQRLSAERQKLQTAYSSLEVEIEQRKKAEETLIQNENKYRLLAENVTDVIWTTDMDLNMTYFSPSVHHVRGYTVEEIMRLKVEEQLTPESMAVANQTFVEELAIESREEKVLHRSRTLELETKCKDGSTKWSETKLSFIRDSKAQAIGILGVSRDITDRKHSEQALAETQSLLLASIEQTPAGIIIADAPDVRIRIANSAALGIRGQAPEALVDIPAKLHPHHWQTYHPTGTPFEPEELPLSQAVLYGKISKNVDVIIRRRDHEERWVSANAAPVRNKEGQIVAGVVVFSDVTELKQAEEEKRQLEANLMQAQKMEAIGTLAGGIAHDFNNILSAIIGYTELSQMSLPKESEVKGNLDKILKAGNRARDLVQQILTFSRQKELALKPVSVNVIVKETLKLLRASMPSTIDIKQLIKVDSLVMGDATQIHRIIMNLCTNAGHAMQSKGGILEVDLRNVELDSGFASQYPGLQAGPHLKLTVRDTGHGIPADVLDRIFDPFFTTKQRGEGTGMGLAVVHGIVKTYGGTINVYSKPGKGSNFEVLLPALANTLESDMGKKEILPKGTERILFVDDEPALVEIGEQMLKSLGYQVVTRTSSVEALGLFRAQPVRFDLVIADITMPQMTGDRLAGELIAIRKDLPVILCTGFSDPTTEAKAKKIGIKGFLMKPIVLRELSKNVRRVLDEN